MGHGDSILRRLGRAHNSATLLVQGGCGDDKMFYAFIGMICLQNEFVPEVVASVIHQSRCAYLVEELKGTQRSHVTFGSARAVRKNHRRNSRSSIRLWPWLWIPIALATSRCAPAALRLFLVTFDSPDPQDSQESKRVAQRMGLAYLQVTHPVLVRLRF